MYKLNIDPRRKEIIYNLTGPLLAQYICGAGALVSFIMSTVGLIKGEEGLFLGGVLIAPLSTYTCYLYHKKFNNIMNKLKNDPSKLEQELGE